MKTARSYWSIIGTIVGRTIVLAFLAWVLSLVARLVWFLVMDSDPRFLQIISQWTGYFMAGIVGCIAAVAILFAVFEIVGLLFTAPEVDPLTGVRAAGFFPGLMVGLICGGAVSAGLAIVVGSQIVLGSSIVAGLVALVLTSLLSEGAKGAMTGLTQGKSARFGIGAIFGLIVGMLPFFFWLNKDP